MPAQQLEACTRNVGAFLKKTAISYHPNQIKKGNFWWYTVAVLFKNVSTLPVQYLVDTGSQG